MASGKRVCVVGAGVSGLVATKECLSAGLSPTCFEIKDGIGGLWNRNDSAKESTTPMVWDNLITNTAKYCTCFSDFPFSPDDTPYVTWKVMKSYLHQYADHFGLHPYIRLNTRVIKIYRTSDHQTTGRWKVITAPTSPQDQNSFETEERLFDVVIVCNGYFRKPQYPDIEGMDTFPGPTLHSFYYKNSNEFKDKTVMVVGNGFSAIDIAEDVAHNAAKVILTVGQGTWIIPRILSGMVGSLPISYYTTRKLLYSANSEALYNNFLMSEAENRLDHTTSGIRPCKPPTSAPLSLNDNVQIKIMSNKVQVYGQLKSIKGSQAVFTDGSLKDGIDAIIYCTGFRPDFSFLEEEIIQPNGKMELYLMTFPLERTHNTLALVGQAPINASLLPMIELQSRWITMIMSGLIKLPSQRIMRANVEWINDITLKRKGRYSYFLPGNYLMDMIAEAAQVYPKFWRIFLRDPVLAYRTWYGPMYTAHYRLLGPGSQWEKARQLCYDADKERFHSVRHRPMAVLGRNDITGDSKHKLVVTLSVVLPITVALGLYYIKNRVLRV